MTTELLDAETLDKAMQLFFGVSSRDVRVWRNEQISKGLDPQEYELPQPRMFLYGLKLKVKEGKVCGECGGRKRVYKAVYQGIGSGLGEFIDCPACHGSGTKEGV